MRNLSRVTFWAAATFALVMAVVPQPPQLPGNPSDKIQHMVAFAVLAGLGSAAFPPPRMLGLLVGLSGFGALIELFQAIPSLHRDSDPLDWAADTAAAAAVILVVMSCRKRCLIRRDEPRRS